VQPSLLQPRDGTLGEAVRAAVSYLRRCQDPAGAWMEHRPALRFAAEVGDPYLPPLARARSALEAVRTTAEAHRADRAWERIAPAIPHLVSPDLDPPVDLRFWVWGGMDHATIYLRPAGECPRRSSGRSARTTNRESG
jgi:hypothetical protein